MPTNPTTQINKFLCSPPLSDPVLQLIIHPIPGRMNTTIKIGAVSLKFYCKQIHLHKQSNIIF